MKKLLLAMLSAAALCVGGTAHAGVLTFDDPAEIVIDNDTGIATYTEGGFAFSGTAATYLTLDGSLIGGFDATAPLSLKAVGGGVFSLLSLDQGFFDSGFGDAPGTLSVTGLFNGVQVASQVFNLGAQTTAMFGAGFAGLTEVSFNATTTFALDNVNVAAPVPEPATVALMALGLMGVAIRVNRNRRRG